ncbi:MAG: hypothetical protein QM758_16565 [Armatimonas sp.]
MTEANQGHHHWWPCYRRLVLVTSTALSLALMLVMALLGALVVLFALADHMDTLLALAALGLPGSCHRTRSDGQYGDCRN